MTADRYDVVIVGGGFYGCCLALFLRSVTDRIVIVEAGEDVLTRASAVNQARVHTGFHYPRSFVTALKSKLLHERFAADFPEAVVSDFRMLYAIARERSKVSAGRFLNMFANMGAPIRRADVREAALFDARAVEGVFECREWAFDYSRLRERLAERLDAAGIPILYGRSVEALAEHAEGVRATLSTGEVLEAGHLFNITYAQINQVLRAGGLPEAPLKYELAEVALVEPPPALAGYGITVMDGPFFSAMPYPSAGAYSLTHVRYTPHFSWTDADTTEPAYAVAKRLPRESRHRQMMQDSARFLPAIRESRYLRSLYDVKAVLLKNERDDGRPILYQRRPATSHVTSIMGGKIDNIYDLFDLLVTTPEWRGANAGHLLGRASVVGG